jgi:hypothetical protein
MPYSYQWYLNDTIVPGAIDSTWNFTPITAGNYKVYLSVTDVLNFIVQSNTANITVYERLNVTISPYNLNMFNGTSRTFSSTTTGGAIPYSYQWYVNNSAVTGASGPNWTFTPLSIGTYIIYLNVTDTNSVIAKSNVAIATVEITIIVNITPVHLKMNLGHNQTFSSSVSGGTTPYGYQWYLNDTSVPGATNSNWTFVPITTGSYRVYLNVTDALNLKTQSNIVTDITVYPQLAVSISPTSMNMTIGTPQTFSSIVSGGAQPYTYQWVLNGTAITGATSSTWIFTPTQIGNYTVYLRVTDSLGNQALSNVATNILVYSPLSSITLVSGGSDYTTPVVIISGGGGTGASATARVSNGVIIGIVLIDPGTGYSSAPTITIRDPSPRAKGASATAAF